MPLRRRRRTSSLRPRRDASYDSRELQSLRVELAQIERERLSLADKRELQSDVLHKLQDPELVAERIEWLLDGTFGRGAQIESQRILAARRMNRAASLSLLAMQLDTSAPRAIVLAAWRKLSPRQKTELDAAVKGAIAHAEQHPAHDPRRSSRHRLSRYKSYEPEARKEWISRKIRVLRHEGYPQRQAIAIAYREAGVAPREVV